MKARKKLIKEEVREVEKGLYSLFAALAESGEFGGSKSWECDARESCEIRASGENAFFAMSVKTLCIRRNTC